MGLMGFIDKLDDIIYQPVQLACDWLRQPLKQMDAKNERKKMELESRLASENKERDVELELKRMQMENEINVQARKMNAEIDEMIANGEAERREKLVEAVKRYQKELGEASVELANSIGKMSLELRERAYKLIDERTKDYKKMQDEAIDSSNKRLLQLEEQYPNGGRAKEIMENAVEKQLIAIIDNANQFVQLMQNDISSMTSNIDQITGQAIKNVDSYLDPIKKQIGASNLPFLNG